MTATMTPTSFPVFGTTATAVVDGDEDVASGALDAVKAELAAIDQACSRFRPDSELSHINAAGGRPVAASAVLLEAVGVALRAARLTGGLVDPTVGQALRQLGYDRDFAAVRRAGLLVDEPGGPISAGSILTVLAGPAPGWQVVAVDRARSTITVPVGVELDLGATAKALAADRAAGAAHRATGRGVLISLGGDVAVAGPVPAGGWSVRVTDDHAGPVAAPGQTITMTNGGLATSGTTVRCWRHAGADVHHLVDPATGRPADAIWRTVSVAAGSCVDANTASTAAIVLGPAAPVWLAAHGLPARLVATDASVIRVAGWPEP
ncbi:MAG: FAD:protein FMN transferase [Actinomycetota bacterium]|nr:FAD:protein FMN transferase [Actinomycetota bacterium]